MRRILGRIGLLVLGCLLPFVLVEMVLQVASLGSAWKAGKAAPTVLPRKQRSERVVLCVGDSYTFGVGASSRELSYPSQLAQCLAAAANTPRWSVINEGWPGRNSAELAHGLPGFLNEYQPDYVCVLVGLNNRWSRAGMERAPLPESGLTEATGRWQLRFRIARLLALLRDAWRQRDLSTSAGEEPLEKGQATVPQRDERSKSGRTRLRSHLRLPPDPPGKIQGQSSEGKKEDEHLAALKKALGFLDRQQLEEAHQIVDQSKERVLAGGSRSAAKLLVALLWKMRRYEETLSAATHFIDKHGESTILCGRMILPLTKLGRPEEGLDWAQKALALKGVKPWWLYSSCSEASQAVQDYEASLRYVLLTHTVEGNTERLERSLYKLFAKEPTIAERWESVVTTLGLGEEMRSVLSSMMQKVLEQIAAEAESPAAPDRLEADLTAIVAWVRSVDAQIVLLTYPGWGGAADQAARAVAAREEATLVDLEERFLPYIHDRFDEFFVADHHCNDRGYGVVAEEVEKALRALEEASRRR